MGTPTDPTLVYGLYFHSSVSGITSGYPLLPGFSLGLPELLSVDISALYLQGHSCCGSDPQVDSVPKPWFSHPAVGLLSTLLGQVRSGPAPSCESDNLAKAIWYGLGGILPLEVSRGSLTISVAIYTGERDTLRSTGQRLSTQVALQVKSKGSRSKVTSLCCTWVF